MHNILSGRGRPSPSGNSVYGLDSARAGGQPDSARNGYQSVISVPVELASLHGGSPCSSMNLQRSLSRGSRRSSEGCKAINFGKRSDVRIPKVVKVETPFCELALSVSAYAGKISESVEDKELDSILGPVQQPSKTARRKP